MVVLSLDTSPSNHTDVIGTDLGAVVHSFADEEEVRMQFPVSSQTDIHAHTDFVREEGVAVGISGEIGKAHTSFRVKIDVLGKACDHSHEDK